MATTSKFLMNEQVGGFTHKTVITHADLTETTAATAQTIAGPVVAVGSIVQAVATYLKTDFKDASDAAFNSTAITVGDGTDADRFITSQELNTNGTEVDAKIELHSTNTLPYAYTAADTVDVVFNAMTGKSLSNIDTGELWVFYNIVNLGDQ